MIKESIFSFLKIRKVLIIIFTGIVVVFGVLFYLYDIPFDAIIYGCELSFVWSAVCLSIDFYKYYKRHKLLHINREQFFDDAEQLPEHMDIIEYDYQELAKELYQAKQELISKNRIAKKELLDYYGMWVHQIKMNFKPTGRYIVTDDKWFVFVLEQLISNALKYTKKGQISIYMKEKSLVIEDTGIGIPAEDLPRIFEKGFTGYNGRENKKSTGIGLYLCKNIMDKLQWNITADSEVGRGTKIYLTKM